jgi:ABC-type antimicrobial peptide transport system permease subunit
LGYLASTFSTFQIFYSSNIFASGIGFSIAIGLVAGIAPAILAAKMDPVVALRK